MDSVNQKPARGIQDMGSTYWRTQLSPEKRQKIVNSVIKALEMRLPSLGPNELSKIRNIAATFEEKVYVAATSQADYLRKILKRILSLRSLPNNTAADSLMFSLAQTSQNFQGQGQSHLCQQLSSQSNQNNIIIIEGQSSASLVPMDLTWAVPPNALCQDSNFQSIPSLLQDSVGTPVGKTIPNNYHSQVQGRQDIKHVMSLKHEQQYWNREIHNHKSQIRNWSSKQENLTHSPLPPHTQQPKHEQLQKLSSFLSTESMLQKHPQAIMSQHCKPQQAPVIHQQHKQLLQQTTCPSQNKVLMGQQLNTINRQQNQVVGRQNSVPRIQQKQAQEFLCEINNNMSMHQRRLPEQRDVRVVQQRHQSMSQVQLGAAKMEDHPPLQLDKQQIVSGSMLQSQNQVEQKINSTSVTNRGAHLVGWQEEVFQKVTRMKHMYVPKLDELHQEVTTKIQKCDATSKAYLEKLKGVKLTLEHLIASLQMSKDKILPSTEGKLNECEKKIVGILKMNWLTNPGASPLLSPQPETASLQHLQQKESQAHQKAQPVFQSNKNPQLHLELQEIKTEQIKKENMKRSITTRTGSPSQSKKPPSDVQPSTTLGPPARKSEESKVSKSQSRSGASVPTAPLVISSPGISASSLLAESDGEDDNLAGASESLNTRSVESPFQRLMKMVNSMSPLALLSAVTDIRSVVSLIEKVAGSATANGSRAAGEDLSETAKYRLQARSFPEQYGAARSRITHCYTSTPSNFTGMDDECGKFFDMEISDSDSTATPCIKRQRIETRHSLLDEMREVNQQLIETTVHFSDEDVDATGCGEGTIVKCSFNVVAAQTSSILPLRLLVPTNYPDCSPIILEMLPMESDNVEDLFVKAKSKLNRSLRSLAEPFTLRDIARNWDVCAHSVIVEHAEQTGGGSFSSRYGTWDSCIVAAL